MEKEFIPYEQALELKQLGFDEPCVKEFHKQMLITNSCGDEMTNSELIYLYGKEDNVIAAPLYQQSFRWFIENYGKNGILFSDGCQWTFDLRWEDDDDYGYPSIQFPKREVGREMFDTYEEARFECLKKLIEIVKTK
jgi:hypothetical protein